MRSQIGTNSVAEMVDVNICPLYNSPAAKVTMTEKTTQFSADTLAGQFWEALATHLSNGGIHLDTVISSARGGFRTHRNGKFALGLDGTYDMRIYKSAFKVLAKSLDKRSPPCGSSRSRT